MTDSTTLWTSISGQVRDAAIGLDLESGDLIELFAQLKDAGATDGADKDLIEALETFQDAITTWMLARGYI